MDTKSRKILTKKTLVSTKVNKSDNKSATNSSEKVSNDDLKELPIDAVIKEEALETGASIEEVLKSDASVGGLAEKSASQGSLSSDILEAIEEQDLVNSDGSIKKDTITTLKSLERLGEAGKKDIDKEGDGIGELKNEVSSLSRVYNNSLSEDLNPEHSKEGVLANSFNHSLEQSKLKKIPLNKKKLSTAPLGVLLPELGDIFELSSSINKFQEREAELKQRMIERDSEAGKDLYAEETMLSQILNWLSKK